MRKFIVLVAMLFIAGSAFGAGISSSKSSNKKKFTNPNTAGGTVLTQGDQSQVAGQLKGEGENKSIDGGGIKAQEVHKNQLFPKVQMKGKKSSAVQGKFSPAGKKNQSDHKYSGKGKKTGFIKGEKQGFGKVQQKGFHKNEKGFHKNEAGSGAEGTQIDDDVTWGKNAVKSGKMQKGKGFLKLQDANKQVGGAQMPAAK